MHIAKTGRLTELSVTASGYVEHHSRGQDGILRQFKSIETIRMTEKQPSLLSRKAAQT